MSYRTLSWIQWSTECDSLVVFDSWCTLAMLVHLSSSWSYSSEFIRARSFELTFNSSSEFILDRSSRFNFKFIRARSSDFHFAHFNSLLLALLSSSWSVHLNRFVLVHLNSLLIAHLYSFSLAHLSSSWSTHLCDMNWHRILHYTVQLIDQFSYQTRCLIYFLHAAQNDLFITLHCSQNTSKTEYKST